MHVRVTYHPAADCMDVWDYAMKAMEKPGSVGFKSLALFQGHSNGNESRWRL